VVNRGDNTQQPTTANGGGNEVRSGAGAKRPARSALTEQNDSCRLDSDGNSLLVTSVVRHFEGSDVQVLPAKRSSNMLLDSSLLGEMDDGGMVVNRGDNTQQPTTANGGGNEVRSGAGAKRPSPSALNEQNENDSCRLDSDENALVVTNKKLKLSTGTGKLMSTVPFSSPLLAESGSSFLQKADVSRRRCEAYTDYLYNDFEKMSQNYPTEHLCSSSNISLLMPVEPKQFLCQGENLTRSESKESNKLCQDFLKVQIAVYLPNKHNLPTCECCKRAPATTCTKKPTSINTDGPNSRHKFVTTHCSDCTRNYAGDWFEKLCIHGDGECTSGKIYCAKCMKDRICTGQGCTNKVGHTQGRTLCGGCLKDRICTGQGCTNKVGHTQGRTLCGGCLKDRICTGQGCTNKVGHKQGSPLCGDCKKDGSARG